MESIETKLQKISHDLEERNKELKCLYGILGIVGKKDSKLEDILRAATDLISEATQYPEITCVRIKFQDRIFLSNFFMTSPWKLASDILFHEKKAGSIEVFYTREREDIDEGPFLNEERSLINSIAQILGGLTESKRDEEALAESENRFRLLAENAQDVIYRMSLPDGVYEYVSPASKKIFGYSPDEFYTRPLLIRKIIHSDWIDNFEEKWSKIVSGDIQPSYEYKIFHKSGEEIWVNQRDRLVYDDNGTPIAIEGIVTDITERKREEIERAKTEEQLIERNHFIETILDNLPIGLAVNYIEEGKATYINKKFEEIYGWPAAELENIEEFFQKIYPDQVYRDRIKKMVFSDIQSGDSEQMIWRGVEIEGKDGRKKAVEAKNIPLEEQNLMISTVQDITYQVEAQKKLTESEAKYQSVFENAATAMVIIEEDTTISMANVEFVRLSGYSAQEVQGKMKWTDFVAWQHMEKMKRYHRDRRKEGKTPPLEYDFHFIDRKGSMRDIRVKVGIIPGTSKTVAALLDVTEQKRAEELIKNERARLKQILDNFPSGIYIVNKNYEIEYSNPMLEKELGPVKGRKCFEYIHDLQDICPWCKNEKVFNGQSVRWEWNSKKNQKTYELYDIPLTNADGTFSKLEVFYDITDRKLAESHLSKQKELFQAILNNMPLMIVFFSPDGRPFWVNKNWEQILGWSLEETKEKDILKELYPDPEYQKYVNKFIEKAEGKWGDFTTRTRSGEVIETSWINITLSDGSTIGIGADVTEKRLAERNRRELEQRLNQAQKMEAIGTLAGGIAHDFNNILASVIGFTELALGEVEKGSALEDDLKEVFNAGNRARELVKQILSFSRRSGEEIMPIRVSKIAKEALKLLRSTIPSNIGIRQNIKSDSLILGNPIQIHQIIMNITSNAAQAMEKNGGILGVSLSDAYLDHEFSDLYPNLKNGHYIKLTVSDTGMGIAPDIIDSIFDPYFTTKEPGTGTGMGLATVHGLLKSHGGEITVESKVGKGSVFNVFFPITKKKAEKKSYQSSKKIPHGNERILFVDDELPVAKMGQQILKNLGYQVEMRISSLEALALFGSRPKDFDLIITDMTMPDMTGDTLATELLKIRPDIPIILCTGYSKKINEKKAAQIGIRAFAFKPLRKSDLAEIVRNVLDQNVNIR